MRSAFDPATADDEPALSQDECEALDEWDTEDLADKITRELEASGAAERADARSGRTALSTNWACRQWRSLRQGIASIAGS